MCRYSFYGYVGMDKRGVERSDREWIKDKAEKTVRERKQSSSALLRVLSVTSLRDQSQGGELDSGTSRTPFIESSVEC